MIADAHNGIIFLRNGRQIDVVKPPKRFYSVNATTDPAAAINLIYGDLSTGANNDLVGNTELARKMVREWGMSTELGPMARRPRPDDHRRQGGRREHGRFQGAGRGGSDHDHRKGENAEHVLPSDRQARGLRQHDDGDEHTPTGHQSPLAHEGC